MATSNVIDDLKRRIAIIESGCSCGASNQADATYSKCEEELGSNIDESEYGHVSNGNNVEQEDGSKLAFKKIIALVNHADRSEKAVRERLQRDGFKDVDIDHAVQRALEYGFIDDARFAEVLIRSRISKLRGSAGIVRELSENGIEAMSIPGWPNDFGISHEEELDRALAYLRKKPPRSKNARDGAYRKLLQHGFSSDVALSAARVFVDEVQG